MKKDTRRKKKWKKRQTGKDNVKQEKRDMKEKRRDNKTEDETVKTENIDNGTKLILKVIGKGGQVEREIEKQTEMKKKNREI